MRRWLCAALIALAMLPAAGAVTLTPFQRGSYPQLVAAHQGKPFIVAFWSVNCSYCSGELALLRKLQQKFPTLELVLVSTDTLADRAQIEAALGKLALGQAESWVFADTHVERLRFEIDREWYGELPRTYFHGADGTVWAASGQLEAAAIERWFRLQSAAR